MDPNQPTPTPVEQPVTAEPTPAPVEVIPQSADVPVTVEDLAGVPEGTELKSSGVAHSEVVVADYELDQDGNQVLGADGQPVVIGWHKEVV